MSRGKKYYNKKRSVSIKAVKSMIRPDVLKNVSTTDIAKLHNLKIGDVDKAIRSLKDTDIEVQKVLSSTNDDIKENIFAKTAAEIDSDTKKCICSDYESCQYTQKELADRYKLSTFVISAIVKSMIPATKLKEIKNSNIRNARKRHTADKVKMHDNDNTIPEEENIEKTTELVDFKNIINEFSDDIVLINPDESYLTVGLVNNRHSMKIDKFIFDSIDDADIFNFIKLQNTASEFIKNNIKFDNGIPKQGLIVKCTGLQSAIMAVTKVCYDMKVNLIVSHYQISSSGVNPIYRQQPIFTDFTTLISIPNIISYISEKTTNLYLYKSSIENYENIDTFYEIRVISKPDSCRVNKDANSIKPINEYSIVTLNMIDAMNVNIQLAKHFTTSRNYYRSIILREYKYDYKMAVEYSNIILQRAYY